VFGKTFEKVWFLSIEVVSGINDQKGLNTTVKLSYYFSDIQDLTVYLDMFSVVIGIHEKLFILMSYAN
jgi:hypothetical protein